MHVRSDKMKNFRKKIPLLIVCLFLLFMAIIGSSVYWPSPVETPCHDIPEGTVVIALAFKHAGKDMETGKYLPGKANERINEKLEECAGRFRIILTQKAVSDALENENKLKNGVPIEEMHKDTVVDVRTLGAVCCAIERLKDYPENLTIGLIAHDKHFKRSRQALEAVLRDMKPAARIVDIHLGKTSHQDDAFYRPWCWAARELLLAWPAQHLLTKLGCFQCSDKVAILDKLSPIVAD
jgi:hypothetical protein